MDYWTDVQVYESTLSTSWSVEWLNPDLFVDKTFEQNNLLTNWKTCYYERSSMTKCFCHKTNRNTDIHTTKLYQHWYTAMPVLRILLHVLLIVWPLLWNTCTNMQFTRFRRASDIPRRLYAQNSQLSGIVAATHWNAIDVWHVPATRRLLRWKHRPPCESTPMSYYYIH